MNHPKGKPPSQNTNSLQVDITIGFWQSDYTLVKKTIAIENGPVEDVFPVKNGDILLPG